MANELRGFLTEWHRLVSAKDVAALGRVLAADVSIGAPPYWARIEGHARVHHLLGLILATIEEFTYHREWQQGHELALEFTGRVAELELQGIDLITLDDRFAIQKIDVLMRPISAVGRLRDLIAPQMAAFIARREGAAAS